MNATQGAGSSLEGPRVRGPHSSAPSKVPTRAPGCGVPASREPQGTESPRRPQGTGSLRWPQVNPRVPMVAQLIKLAPFETFSS